MEAVIFIGIQATGKSSFFKAKFFDTHIRINLDMLNTRHREKLLLQACLEMKQPFVVDNTNSTLEDRIRYISAAKEAGFRIIGYYFQSKLQDAVQRNSSRPPSNQIPHVGIRSTYSKLVLPSLAEGFDALYYVTLEPNQDFIVDEWQDEV
ncbi:MAG: kinase [Ardenticatenaceae bacterium]|nr:kinase [Ardenticatenaceae bacterium]